MTDVGRRVAWETLFSAVANQSAEQTVLADEESGRLTSALWGGSWPASLCYVTKRNLPN